MLRALQIMPSTNLRLRRSLNLTSNQHLIMTYHLGTIPNLSTMPRLARSLDVGSLSVARTPNTILRLIMTQHLSTVPHLTPNLNAGSRSAAFSEIELGSGKTGVDPTAATTPPSQVCMLSRRKQLKNSDSLWKQTSRQKQFQIYIASTYLLANCIRLVYANKWK